MYLELLRHPGESFARIRDRGAPTWILVLFGFGSTEFQRGYELLLRQPSPFSAKAAFPIAFMFVVTLFFNSWMWATLFGGLLHGAARVLKGHTGLFTSIRVTAAALFWPGILIVCSIVLDALLHERGNGRVPATLVTLVTLALRVAGAVWASFNVVYAIRVRHMFSWRRALAVYASCILIFVGLCMVFWRVLLPQMAKIWL